jgi:hypothetical protein
MRTTRLTHTNQQRQPPDLFPRPPPAPTGAAVEAVEALGSRYLVGLHPSLDLRPHIGAPRQRWQKINPSALP